MKFAESSGSFLPLAATVWLALTLSGQTAVDTKNWTAAEDHRNMMEQLGIRALRPGPSGNESAPNHANYDEATANPYPEPARRAHVEERQEGHDAGNVVESAAAGDRRGFRARGAGPRSEERSQGDVGSGQDGRSDRWAASGRRQAARRDMWTIRRTPAIKVDIQMTLVSPADAKGPVPVMMMFGGAHDSGSRVSGAGFPAAPVRPGRGPAGPPPARECRSAGDRATDRRWLGLSLPSIPTAFRPTTARV